MASPPIIPPATGVIYFKNLLALNNLGKIKILINLLKIYLSVPLSARMIRDNYYVSERSIY